jgi:hypothetical protein
MELVRGVPRLASATRIRFAGLLAEHASEAGVRAALPGWNELRVFLYPSQLPPDWPGDDPWFRRAPGEGLRAVRGEGLAPAGTVLREAGPLAFVRVWVPDAESETETTGAAPRSTSANAVAVGAGILLVSGIVWKLASYKSEMDARARLAAVHDERALRQVRRETERLVHAGFTPAAAASIAEGGKHA